MAEEGAGVRTAGEKQCTFFKKPPANRNMRKRAQEDDDAGENEASAVIQKAKAARKGGLASGTTKEQQKLEELAPGVVYESSREIQTHDSLATAALETETEFDKDGRALRERRLKMAAKRFESGGGGQPTSKPDEKKVEVYKGMNSYTDHRAGFRRENTIAAEKVGGAHGPLRASQHIRMSARMDYQPDVCKDYKETGYCGFGDACKFMHDRGDYKSGWELDKEWEEAQKAKREKLERQMKGLLEQEGEEKDGDDEDDELPFACFICREPFVDPVVTSCKHYFCEHCALKHHAKHKTCFVCNKATNGLFNTAHEILKKRRKL